MVSFLEHVRNLESLCDHYDREAREYHQRRETRKADLALTKMKLVMKEVYLTFINLT